MKWVETNLGFWKVSYGNSIGYVFPRRRTYGWYVDPGSPDLESISFNRLPPFLKGTVDSWMEATREVEDLLEMLEDE